MLLLSPRVTAAKQSASRMPASSSTSRSKTGPDELLAEDVLALVALEHQRVLVDDRDRVSLELEHAREVAADSAVPADDYVQPVLHLASPRLHVRSRAGSGAVPT